MNRRTFLKAFLHVSAGTTVTGVATGIYGTQIEPTWHKIERLTLPIRNLPEAFEGYTLVHLSDIHIMGERSVQIAQTAIQDVVNLAADTIVITGDFVTGAVEADPLYEVLAPLNAPDGVWTVMGNHDHWSGVEAVREVVESAGIMELRNTNTAIERDNQILWLAGVDDIWERQYDLEAALDGIAQNEPTILLAHEPDFADAVKTTYMVSAQLSGHSHGGQIRLPVLGAPVLPYLGEKYPIGLRRLDGMWLYTNRGVGSIPPVVRVNCRPEVTHITLTRA